MENNRSAAIRKQDSFYFTNKPCKRGHIDVRYTKNGSCKSCVEHKGREHYINNKEKYKEHNKKWYKNNPDKRKQFLKKSNRKWKTTNKQKVAEYNKQFREDNKYLINYWANMRRAKLLNATPVWADLDKIKQIYAERDRISKETGIDHHVDHIIPLQGKNVSGLHIAENLQIIPATENFRKNNSYG